MGLMRALVGAGRGEGERVSLGGAVPQGAGAASPGQEAQALPSDPEFGVRAWLGLMGLHQPLSPVRAVRARKPGGPNQLLLPSCSHVLPRAGNLLPLPLSADPVSDTSRSSCLRGRVARRKHLDVWLSG